MDSETITAAIPAARPRRPRIHLVSADGRALEPCPDLAQAIDLAPDDADADWVVPFADGDVAGPDAAAALLQLPLGPAAPAAILFDALRRVDGREWPMPSFDDSDALYGLAASAGFSLAAIAWRGDVWRGLQPSGAALTHARLALVRLIESGDRIGRIKARLLVRTGQGLDRDDPRGALQAALAATAAIAIADGELRWPHAPLMTVAELAGAAIGAGVYHSDLLADAPTLAAAAIDDSELAFRFLCGLRATAPTPLESLAAARETVRADIDHFFDEAISLGAAARPCDAARLRVLHAGLGLPAADVGRLAITPIDIDIAKPLGPIKGVGPRMLLARVHHEGRDIDWIQMPTIDGAAASDVQRVLRDALERQPTWRIGQLPGVRSGPEFIGSLAFAAARAAPDAALAAGKGAIGRAALQRLRTKIVRDAQISRLPSLRAKKVKGRPLVERPVHAPMGSATRIPVLMYHAITPLDAKASRFALPLSAFEEQLRWLAEAGYQSIAAAEWANAIRSGRPVPEKSVLITFDDAYVDFADHAWPALRRNGFWATLFAPAGCIGKSPSWRGAAKDQRILDARTLRTLADDGCEIGSHAMSHRHLTAIGPDDMLEEAFDSRKILEDVAGQPVDIVAYPFGASDTAVRSAFVMAGYRGGFTAWGGASTLDDDPMNIARIEIRGDCDLATFAAQIAEATQGPSHSAAVASRWAS